MTKFFLCGIVMALTHHGFSQTVVLQKTSISSGAIHTMAGQISISSSIGQTSPVTAIGNKTQIFQGFQFQNGAMRTSQPMMAKTKISMFPNPTKGELFFKMIEYSSDLHVSISDLHGKEVSRQAVQHTGEHGYASFNLASGVYLVTLTSGNTLIAHELIVFQ